MENTRLIELIAKKLTSKIAKEESTELAGLLENPDHKIVFEDLKRKWETSGKLKLKNNSNTEKSWLEFEKKANKSGAKEIKMLPMLFKVAAVLAIALGLGYFYFQQAELNRIEFYTKSGEIREIVLPDSSHVWLNGSSYLAFDESFNASIRQVVLKGEAFFEVERNKEKPFVVLSQQSKTEVLGTSFNVSAYDSLPFVSINVNSGKVAFSEINSLSNKVTLTKGESAKLDLGTLALSKDLNRNQNYLSWRTKELFFDDATLEIVIKDLSKYFGTPINFETGQINHCKFTSNFFDPSLEEVLEVLSITLDLTYTKTSQGYLLSGKGC